MFEEGDFINLKAGTTLESGESIEDWAGTILTIDHEEKSCLVLLDALSIDTLTDAQLKASKERGVDFFEYSFKFQQIEPSSPRSTEEELMEAFERFIPRIENLENMYQEAHEVKTKKWIEEFRQSSFFISLDLVQQKETSFIITHLMEFVRLPTGSISYDWKPAQIKTICLETIPREVKITINYGAIFIQYFEFLGAKNYIPNATALIDAVKEVKQKIIPELLHPENWSTSKAFIMADDLDITDLETIKTYKEIKQLESRKELVKMLIKETINPNDPIDESQLDFFKQLLKP